MFQLSHTLACGMQVGVVFSGVRNLIISTETQGEHEPVSFGKEMWGEVGKTFRERFCLLFKKDLRQVQLLPPTLVQKQLVAGIF